MRPKRAPLTAVYVGLSPDELSGIDKIAQSLDPTTQNRSHAIRQLIRKAVGLDTQLPEGIPNETSTP